ncbi:glycosyltransferase [Streptomyces spiramyceticus]|uniref:glycosyltransferase n=1 Tax=Streptomyces spiramyceticus TaxID=299717 RepID=UPI00237BBBE7|nr:glycosyltransferase [Streptomyces spiramyceticus]
MSDPFGGVVGLLHAAAASSDVPSVAVLVDLVRTPSSGGQIKCWEHFAEAAAGMSPAALGVDLTVYTLGEAHRVERLSPAVRFVSVPPLLSTAPLVRKAGADVCDLSPHHPALNRLLPLHSVWHLTHMFSLANTAVRLRRTRQRAGPANRPGLVASVHTDVPALTSSYVQELLGRAPARLMPRAAPARLGELSARLARHRRDRLLRACDLVLVATPQERTDMTAVVGEERVSLLGRGVDHRLFRPDASARAELTRSHGVPADRTVVLFAGRADASKRVTLLAEAVRRLRDEGRSVHLVVAGTGHETEQVSRLLGLDATLLGTVSQDRLGRVYAGCDVFALPSLTETIGNVVGEAMACGLPVVLPAGARTTRWLASPGDDGLVVADDSVAGWARALAALVDDPAARAAMGRRAAATARATQRTWAQVLTEDLVPVWREVAPLRSPRAG